MDEEEWADDDGEDDGEVDLDYARAEVAGARVTRTWLDRPAIDALAAEGWDEADLVARVLAGEPGDVDPDAIGAANDVALGSVLPLGAGEPDDPEPSIAGEWFLAAGDTLRVEVEIGADESYAEHRQPRRATAYVFVH